MSCRWPTQGITCSATMGQLWDSPAVNESVNSLFWSKSNGKPSIGENLEESPAGLRSDFRVPPKTTRNKDYSLSAVLALRKDKRIPKKQTDQVKNLFKSSTGSRPMPFSIQRDTWLCLCLISFWERGPYCFPPPLPPKRKKESKKEQMKERKERKKERKKERRTLPHRKNKWGHPQMFCFFFVVPPPGYQCKVTGSGCKKRTAPASGKLQHMGEGDCVDASGRRLPGLQKLGADRRGYVAQNGLVFLLRVLRVAGVIGFEGKQKEAMFVRSLFSERGGGPLFVDVCLMV